MNDTAPVGGDDDAQGHVGATPDPSSSYDERVLSVWGTNWGPKFLEAKRYIEGQQIGIIEVKKDHGPGWIPNNATTEACAGLGKWGQTIRTLYNNKDKEPRMTPERIKMLEEIGFVFSLGSFDEQWNAMCDKLKKFKDTNQHCLVPSDYEEDPKLGKWVRWQRQVGEDKHPQWRRDKLNSLGFVWNVHDAMNEAKQEKDAEAIERCKQYNGGVCIYKTMEAVYADIARHESAEAQGVATTTTPTSMEASKAIVIDTVRVLEESDVDSPLVAVHFASVSKNEYHVGGNKIHGNEDRRTIQAGGHYMTADKKPLSLGEDILAFRLLRDDNDELKFLVDVTKRGGDLVRIDGPISLEKCVEYCNEMHVKSGKPVFLTIQIMTPGTVQDARNREAEGQAVLWKLVEKKKSKNKKARFIGVMNTKSYSPGNFKKDADAFCSYVSVMIGVKELIIGGQFLFSDSIAADSKSLLREEFPEAVFHKWPIPQGTENTDALDNLKVDSQAEETVFKGKSFILTGRLHDLKQETVKQAIKDRGGTVLNQEKRGVKYYLILGTGAWESKSHTNALTNTTNAKIITTDQFLDLVKKGKKNQKKNKK